MGKEIEAMKKYEKTNREDSEKELLEEINRDVPPGIDWKKGAVEYLRNLTNDKGRGTERYHLIKPFIGGPDYDSFYIEMYKFLNMAQRLPLTPQTRILDVGCGPGWTSHYFGKLGLSVLGFDISPDMIQTAKRRVAADPLSTYEDRSFDVDFMVHDIEKAPLPVSDLFDTAFLESALHHFYDPISALKNISKNLTSDGIIAITESTAPDKDSLWQRNNRELMEKYHTLERPYSRDQMIRLLRISGFTHMIFLYPVNGLFEHVPRSMDIVRESFLEGREWNICLASKDAEALKKAAPEYRDKSENEPLVDYIGGFYGEEKTGQAAFRWSQIESVIMLFNVNRIKFKISSLFPRFYNKEQSIFVYSDGSLYEKIVLTETMNQFELTMNELNRTVKINFYSDSVFSPYWHDETDGRLLSFMLEVISYE